MDTPRAAWQAVHRLPSYSVGPPTCALAPTKRAIGLGAIGQDWGAKKPQRANAGVEKLRYPGLKTLVSMAAWQPGCGADRSLTEGPLSVRDSRRS